VVLGCSKPRCIYEVDPAFRTVAPDPRKDRIFIREGMHPLNPDLHLKAVLIELASRNYGTAPVAEADLWVMVYVLVRGRPEGIKEGSNKPSHRKVTEGSQRGRGRSGAGGGGAASAGGVKGDFTVIVQLQDRKSGLPVWQGEATFDPQQKGPDGGPLSTAEAVRELLQPLPARP
jgi:hypothetical protein